MFDLKHPIWNQYDVGLNNSCICKICGHVYENPNQSTLKGHYMGKHDLVWASIRINKKGRKAKYQEKKNLLIQKERERIFSVAERLNDEFINSMIQEKEPSVHHINDELNNENNDIETISKDKNEEKSISYINLIDSIEFEGHEKIEVEIGNIPIKASRGGFRLKFK
ncbi:881_t:CDS:1 [Scutellospora calospora]|uniref:881_t:CDS:1 n=1 Tax=Scutellospora calospora TaxID=85575 RepID=A0ACA9KIR6_9GLOM|nr:881_t:CDS:1 [Scutellospora calospora]